MMVQTKCKLNNTELSALVNLFHIRAKKLGTTRTTKKQQNFKNGTVRFRLNIDIRKGMEDSRLNAIKQPIPFVKGRLNFSSKTTTAAIIKRIWLRALARCIARFFSPILCFPTSFLPFFPSILPKPLALFFVSFFILYPIRSRTTYLSHTSRLLVFLLYRYTTRFS